MNDPGNPDYADSNHYAFPLPVSPVIDAVTNEVIRIDVLPTGADAEIKKLAPQTWPRPNEYTPEYQQLRTDLKPLNVIQPEGASFKVTSVGETGHFVEWQKWSFRVGFNLREGMVLYDVGLPYFVHRSDGADVRLRFAMLDEVCSIVCHYRI